MIAQLLNQAPFGYFSFFDDGIFFAGNETLYSIIGYTHEELAGKHVETIFTIATRIFHQTHFFPLLKLQGHAEEIFITLLTKDKRQLPVLVNARRVEWNGSLLNTCAFIVVYNRKKFEDELVAARKAAEAALSENSELINARAELQRYTEQLDAQIRVADQQNHELKQFSHVVTHNLKEPLRKMLVYSERLQSYDLPGMIRPDVMKLRKAATQLRNVIDGLQQYLWLNEAAHHFTRTDISQQLHLAVRQLGEEQTSLMELHTQLQGLPYVEADPGQLQLLFYHLLQNAIKFRRDEKAYVTITGTVLKRNWFQQVENKYRYEDFLRLEIRDEGIGFDPVGKENLFQVFRKLHYTEGLGMGLALCRIIAANHNGSIEADSILNESTVFTVWLPLKQAGA